MFQIGDCRPMKNNTNGGSNGTKTPIKRISLLTDPTFLFATLCIGIMIIKKLVAGDVEKVDDFFSLKTHMKGYRRLLFKPLCHWVFRAGSGGDVVGWCWQTRAFECC